MTKEEIQAVLKSLTASMNHRPSDKELDALLNAIATVDGYEKNGWIERQSVSETAAEFKLAKLPTDDLINNFVRTLCVKYKLNKNLHEAVRIDRYTLQRREDHHILLIEDQSSPATAMNPKRKWWQMWR